DQGSVYSSKVYNDLITDFNIQRSMSRAGTPTDNPVNESLNGWIKEELFLDFHLRDSDDV
ncbi:MAG: transposase family protein, partial [Erysipelotrichales bacterium]|nr:transposase family protein [Erysipelotrichales bacterium]